MDERAKRRAMEAHAACEETPRAGDGARSWLGLVVIAVFALGSAGLLVFAAWQLAF